MQTITNSVGKFRCVQRDARLLSKARAGFDCLIFHGPPVYGPSRCPFPVSSLTRLLNYRGRDHRGRVRTGYHRWIKYRHVTDPDAPLLAIFYDPREFPRPAFRVTVRATMRRLLDVDAVIRLIVELEHHLTVPLMLSALELAVDLPGGRVRTNDLQRQLYAPRARHVVVSPDKLEWGEWGSRKSARRVRLYTKREDRLTVTRIELTLRRTALRRLGIDTAADLNRVPWGEVACRCFRFVEFCPSSRDTGRVQEAFEIAVVGRGVNHALQRLSRKDRRWVRGRLRPVAVQAEIEEVLRGFEDGLRRGALPLRAVRLDNEV